jgi:hypothetical protein
MLELGECLSLDKDNLPSAVYLSPVQTPPTYNATKAVLCWMELELNELNFLAVPA